MARATVLVTFDEALLKLPTRERLAAVRALGGIAKRRGGISHTWSRAEVVIRQYIPLLKETLAVGSVARETGALLGLAKRVGQLLEVGQQNVRASIDRRSPKLPTLRVLITPTTGPVMYAELPLWSQAA